MSMILRTLHASFDAIAILPDALLSGMDNIFAALKRRGWGDGPAAAVLLLPSLMVLTVFFVVPMFSSVYMSLFGGRHGRGDFIGLGNYVEAMGNADFRQSLLVTLYYVLGVVPCTLLLSLPVAFGLHRIVAGRGLLRSLYFLPYVTSAVAAAMVWRALFNPQSGVANLLLAYAGVEPLNWLLEPRGVLHIITGGLLPSAWGPSLGLICIMLFDIWHGCGFMIVVLLAGLSAIPREFEEAARMDGASGLRLMRHITLPLLSPTLFFLLIVGVIKSFQTFNSFYALTQGAVMPETQNLIMYVYAQFYQYGYWGYGAAAATLLMLAIVALTLVQWRVVGRKVYYS